MNKLIILIAMFPFFINAQENMFIAGEIEGGLITTSYSSLISSSLTDVSIINSEKNNISLKAAISLVLDFESNLSLGLGLSQTIRYWNLEGSATNNELLVKQKLSYPSIFAGAWYNLALSSGNNVNIDLYLGTRFSIDFVNYNSLSDKDGVATDYVESETQESNKVGLNIIPEIGVKGQFKNGDQWLFGIKYYQPLNGNIIEGSLSHYLNNSINEVIAYKASGQVLAASFRYKFKLKR